MKDTLIAVAWAYAVVVGLSIPVWLPLLAGIRKVLW